MGTVFAIWKQHFKLVEAHRQMKTTRQRRENFMKVLGVEVETETLQVLIYTTRKDSILWIQLHVWHTAG